MSTGLEVAVIGLACRFPGARSPEQFWHNLQGGRETITHFTADELAAAGVPQGTLSDPAYVRAQGVLPDADQFDAQFFGISPKEADVMDPQQRILLECAWEALEDAGYDPARIRGPVGVYAGTYYNSYLPALPPVDDPAEQFARNIANEKDYVASRLAYKLDLTGPAVTVQTACSTSLVAVHLAAQALLGGGCDVALAGGATVRARQIAGYHYQPGGIFSADGHCRAFDATAEGTVPGNGAGMVVLKRLDDAIADGDTIYAVIHGSAIGNDGADRAGFTAPGLAGQARVISSAYAVADVDPATVSYVETHGSATRLGDPIEVEALARAFGDSRPGAGCAIGSVKTNIGHTHAAAGVAGLIKTVLALRHGQIPPSLGYTEANPAIDFAATPFYVNTELTEWSTNNGPRRAGVSSFGMGGTGAHVVLQEAPAVPSRPSSGCRVVPLSARDPEALEEATDRLATHLAEHEDLDLGDVAHTLRQGRRSFGHRRVVVANDAAEAAKALADRDPRTVRAATPATGTRRIAFMFPGVGDQRPGLGQQLYHSQPAFRAAVDECAELLRPLMGVDLRTLLHPEPAATGTDRGGVDLRRMLGRGKTSEASPLDRTEHAQPIVFVIGYALARLWEAYGVRPDALLGYSIGEYVAACCSGVLSLDDALRLVVRRALLIAGLPAGGMLAVSAAEPDIAEALVPGVSVAAVNGPKMCVVAGTRAGVDEVQRRLESRGVAVRPLQTVHAFHSPMVDPIVSEFTELVSSVALNPPRIPYLSNVTGTWITAEEATDPGYWARHLRQPVQFAAGVAELWREPQRLLLELGAGQSLSSMALQLRPAENDAPTMSDAPAMLALPSLPAAFEREPEDRFFLGTAGKLWLAGVELDWSADEPDGSPRRVPLPTYPFQRRRHWVDPVPQEARVQPEPSQARKSDVADWFLTPAWTPLPPRPRTAEPPAARGHWLVFADPRGMGSALAAALDRTADSVTIVDMMAPEVGEYDRLLDRLREQDRYPDRIVHLGAFGVDRATSEPAVTTRAFASLLALGQALARQPGREPVELTVVTGEMQVVSGTENGSPVAATVLGPCRVLPLEHPHIRCRSIDIELPGWSGTDAVVEQLLAELTSTGTDAVALRGNRRWQQVYQPVRVEPIESGADGRNYLVTGGLGAVGLALAEALTRAEHAGVALVGRTGLPPRDDWDGWLETHPEEDPTSARILAVQRIERNGGRVAVLTADVTDEGQLRAAADRAVDELGPIYGIVHAAGVAGGGLIQVKEPETAELVLAPKVRGGLAVEALAREIGADVLVLCSSTLALTGAVGQVDYVAANAFLDALAQHASADGGPEVISVNWDAWQDAGMAHRHLGKPASGERVGPVDHPLLDACLEDTAERAVYGVTVNAGTSWLVDEHRMLGDPVVPGTGHLELARAAFTHAAGGGLVELSDVRFFTPVALADDESRELRVVLDFRTDPARFTVVSRYPQDDPAGQARWQVHASGQVRSAASDRAGECDPNDLSGRLADVGRPEHAGPMGFGARSRCLRRVWQGDREALAELVLPDRFAGDLKRIELHPSLLDIAAGFVGVHLAEEFRIPVSYGRLRMYRPLPGHLFSHHTLRESDRAGKETITADISLYDVDGHEVVRIEEFVLKRVPDLRRTLDDARTGTGTGVAFFSNLAQPAVARAGPIGLADHLATGIRPAEGADALRRLLSAGLGPQVVVITKDLEAVRADIAASRLDAEAISIARPPVHPRPNVLTAYREPTDRLERQLAAIWQELLGVEQIGADDSFLELGGHSLLGLEMVNRIGRDLGLAMSLGQLFEAPTVAELATALRAAKER
ncbi:MAG TPA: SDR family oxidoreductase [Micromonosporaceae bacterium]|nr:SDR family oxidoreductase [Micromonosporaceae bacterium]